MSDRDLDLIALLGAEADNEDLPEDDLDSARAMTVGVILGSILWIIVIFILWTVGLAILGG